MFSLTAVLFVVLVSAFGREINPELEGNASPKVNKPSQVRRSRADGSECKARSVQIPAGCNTRKCCFKNAFKTYDKCLRPCSNDDGGVKECPVGYNLYKEGNFCYKFHTECTDWYSARFTCQEEGGDLIILKDDKTLTYFMDLAKKNYGGCMEYGPWLGASDAAKEGDWRWIDGSKVAMDKHWDAGEPNGGLTENYLHLMHTRFLFNDAHHNLNGTSFLCAIQ